MSSDTSIGRELDVFHKLSTPVGVADLERLRRRVATHLDMLEEESFTHEHLEIDLARRIVGVLSGLIEGASTMEPHQRALLHGAVEYFLKTDDEEDDIDSPVGMEDDGRVLNALCHELGREDLVLSLP